MKKQWILAASPVLISIHPEHVEKILAGEKRIEFRRRWPTKPVGSLLIYSTAPIKRIVALVEVEDVIRVSKTRLWALSQEGGGGVSRRELFAYVNGSPHGVALALKRQLQFGDGIDPSALFGADFCPPQSFRYMKEDELEQLSAHIGGRRWA